MKKILRMILYNILAMLIFVLFIYMLKEIFIRINSWEINSDKFVANIIISISFTFLSILNFVICLSLYSIALLIFPSPTWKELKDMIDKYNMLKDMIDKYNMLNEGINKNVMMYIKLGIFDDKYLIPSIKYVKIVIWLWILSHLGLFLSEK
jgi:hypothetical protein